MASGNGISDPANIISGVVESVSTTQPVDSRHQDLSVGEREEAKDDDIDGSSPSNGLSNTDNDTDPLYTPRAADDGHRPSQSQSQSPPDQLVTGAGASAGAVGGSGIKRSRSISGGGDGGDTTGTPQRHTASTAIRTQIAAAAQPKSGKKPRDSMGKVKTETVPGPGTGSGTGPGRASNIKRAAQACLRCRRQKLRCLGGTPCERCERAKAVCDYGNHPHNHNHDRDHDHDKGDLAPLANAHTGAGNISYGSGPGPGPSASASAFDFADIDTMALDVYGTGTGTGTGTDSGVEKGTAANARLEQLESHVANLLAGLGGSIPSMASGSGQRFPPERSSSGLSFNDSLSIDRAGLGVSDGTGFLTTSRTRSSFPGSGTGAGATFDSDRGIGSGANPSSSGWLPPLSPEEMTFRPGQGTGSGSAPVVPATQVRFNSSSNLIYPPAHPHSHSLTSPSQYTASVIDHSPAAPAASEQSNGNGHGKQRGKGKGQRAEERLAAATADSGGYEPPFKPLVYQPAVWDNREQSRRNSPLPSGTQSRDESGIGPQRGYVRAHDDPVTTGLIDINQAEELFKFFIEHCHPFLPIINLTLAAPFAAIRQSPPLISAILAIAARFYARYSALQGHAQGELQDPSLPGNLADLAEAHLARTLLRKQHALSDVQAILLLAAWGLRSGGRGPDAWIVTGHAARTARRLGVHKVLERAAGIARGNEDWEKLEGLMPQWRTWLSWFYFDGLLSLGFGRPQSPLYESISEEPFLDIRVSQAIPRPGSFASLSLSGDVFIAGQVQLVKIARDFVAWGESRGPMALDIVKIGELNMRLDQWCKAWLWTGSRYAIYLGSSIQLVRLQAEHMRLCLNSSALKSSPDQDDIVAGFLKKAMDAATSTIQTHYESVSTDFALSFATDYVTITLAQAAVFLIRLTRSSPNIQSLLNLQSSVVAHFLKLAVDSLISGDLSETRLSAYLAKTIRDIARAAGIGSWATEGEVVDLEIANESSVDGNGRPSMYEYIPDGTGPSSTEGVLPPNSGSGPGFNYITGTSNGNGNGNGTLASSFDLESFLALEGQFDLGYLFGLPSEGVFSGTGAGGTGSSDSLNVNGSGSLFGGFGGGEFGSGLDGLNGGL